MATYSWRLKKVVESIYNNQLKSELTSWADCKSYLLSKNLGHSLKVTNWLAHLLYKKLNKRQASLYEYYLKKVLQNKKFLHTSKSSQAISS